MPSAQQYRRTAQTARGAALGAMAFQAFFNLPFLGRLRWFLFGAKAPKPKITLVDQIRAEQTK